MRLESIKERLEVSKYAEHYPTHYSDDDIEWLVQRLERYETSLKAITEYKAGNALLHVQTLKNVAEEALKGE